MRLLRYFFTVTLIIVGVLMLMVLRDIINPPREIKIKLDPTFVIYPEETIDQIRARRAAEEDVEAQWHREQFENEVAFNLGTDTITQAQFDARYKTVPNIRPASDHLPLN